jgi:hypothetical protein
MSLPTVVAGSTPTTPPPSATRPSGRSAVRKGWPGKGDPRRRFPPKKGGAQPQDQGVMPNSFSSQSNTEGISTRCV